jgi:peptide/nickel transport system permease protein
MKVRARDLTAWIGALIVAGFTFVALAAGRLEPTSPTAQNLSAALAPPGPGHPFGTDPLGRDILARLIAASAVDLWITGAGMLAALAIALPTGLLAGHRGGRWDALIAAASDAVLTFPTIVLAIAIVSLLGMGTTSLIVAVALTTAPQLMRIVRGLAIGLREAPFVEGARAAGSGEARILGRHVLPNIIGSTLVAASLLASQAVLIAAALGFLGLGVRPPAPEWGTMLSDSRPYLVSDPALMVLPGACIALFVLGLNLLGDGLRDALDPRLRGRV